jgi:acyl carrier protein
MDDERHAVFVATLARHTSEDLPGGPVLAEASLVELGFDSMNLVNLLLDLEETFDVVFGEEQLSAETFSTPGTLWEATAALLVERSRD